MKQTNNNQQQQQEIQYNYNLVCLERNFVPSRELQADLPDIQKAKQKNQELLEQIVNSSGNFMLQNFKIDDLWRHIEVVIL